MLTQTEILAAVDAELGTVAALAGTPEKVRWFNEGQARLEWYGHAIEAVAWVEGDLFVALPATVVAVVEILYPADYADERWRPVQGGLLIEDYDGARADGDAKVICRSYWPEVTDVVPSSLPRVGDAACISYVLHRFFRKITADRTYFERYATLAGENGVSISDLADAADDHYRDFLDARNDLPVEPAAPYYGG